jgi:hypothetical protein
VKKFTDEESKILQSLYDKGLNDYQVAGTLHVSRNRLREWRNENNITSKTNKKGLLSNLCPDIMLKRYEGKTFDEIAIDYNVTRFSITKLLNKNGFKYNIPARKTPLEIKYYNLSSNQLEILIGDLYGDGHINRPSEKSAYYSCSHCIEQEEFVFLKALDFRPLSSRIYYGYNSDGYKYVSLSTWSSPSLTKYHNLFYPTGSGDKIIPPLKVTAKSLAYWYMGDGGKFRNDARITVGANVDLKPALDNLNSQYDNLFKASHYERQWTVFINDQEKFFELICPYIHPAMWYKIPVKYQKYCTGDFTELNEFKKMIDEKRQGKIPFKLELNV